MFEFSGRGSRSPVCCADVDGRGESPRPQELRISGHPIDDTTHVIEVEGQVDLYSAPEFKERTRQVIDQGNRRVIIDLSHVSFMDSTGLGVLIGALKRLRAARAELLLVVTDYDIERLFELTGLDGSFKIYRSVDEAIGQSEHAHGA
jgi:anti-sigma B factor antagonist